MFGLRVKYLFGSAGRYIIDDAGNLFEKNIKLTPVDRDGHLQVEILWADGLRYYPVALLVLISFGRFDNFPDHLWNGIEPLYKDGDRTNLNFSNLTYRFYGGRIPAEVFDEEGNFLEGFFHIPGFPGFAIKETGEVWNFRSQTLMTWYVTKPCPVKKRLGGYRYSNIVGFSGSPKSSYRHRLLCLTFHGYGHDVDELVVNHKDGDKTNDDLENLELVTHKDNNDHARKTGLASGSQREVEVCYRDGRPSKVYSSVREAIRDNGGRFNNFINGKIIGEDRKWPRHDIAFRYLDGPDWPDGSWDEAFNHYSTGFRARGTNVETGQVVEFTGINRGESLTGVYKNTIYYHLKKGSKRPTKEGWVFERIGAQCEGDLTSEIP